MSSSSTVGPGLNVNLTSNLLGGFPGLGITRVILAGNK